MIYHPDKWCLLEIQLENKEIIHKVLGSWWGGFIGGNSWRINSGIKKVVREEDSRSYNIKGHSDSVYICRFGEYGYNMIAHGQVKDVDCIRVVEDEKEAYKILSEYETPWSDSFIHDLINNKGLH